MHVIVNTALKQLVANRLRGFCTVNEDHMLKSDTF